MAAARRVSLFRREIKERVSPAGFELLLAAARKISEGRLTGAHYDGSTMLTLDLATVDDGVRDACDVATALHLGQLLRLEPTLLERARALAAEDARRLAARPLSRLELEVRIQVEGCRILIDIDVEGEAQPLTAQHSR